MKEWLICNLFHRSFWLGIREQERLKMKPLKVIHCIKCDVDKTEVRGEV